MFSLFCVWINGWENNRDAGDLRRYRAYYDVIVMLHRVDNVETTENCWESSTLVSNTICVLFVYYKIVISVIFRFLGKYSI